MPTRLIAAMLLLLGTCLCTPAVAQQTTPDSQVRDSPEIQRARLRVSRAQQALRQLEGRVGGERERQRKLKRDIERLEKMIADAEGIVAKNETQVEEARNQWRAAGEKVDELEGAVKDNKKALDEKRTAFDEAKAAATKAFEQTSDYQRLKAHSDGVNAKLEAASKACIDKLGANAEYKKLVAARDAGDARLGTVRTTGDAGQIAAASQAALDARNKVNVMEDQALAIDPAVIEARNALKAAEAELATARAAFEKTWLEGPEAAQARTDAETAEKTLLESSKAKNKAEQTRNDLDRKVRDMASELASRKTKLGMAKNELDNLETELEKSEDRLADAEAERISAEAELRVATAEFERLLNVNRNPPRR